MKHDHEKHHEHEPKPAMLAEDPQPAGDDKPPVGPPSTGDDPGDKDEG